MSLSVYPSNYILANSKQTKQVNVVLTIDGYGSFALSPVYRKVRYNDPDIIYGLPGLVYGALKLDPTIKTILSMESQIQISQKLEPEQGRGSIATMGFTLTDFQKQVLKLVSPGVVIPDILGRSVKVQLGYSDTSFPEDYFVVFRGNVTGTEITGPSIQLKLSDANQKRRFNIFQAYQTKLAANISSSATTIPVISNASFYQQVLGPDNTYDAGIKTYITIGDEVIEYPATGYGVNTFTSCIRGARGTVASAHNVDDDVNNTIEIKGNAIDLALKMMLSGWNGPYVTDLKVQALGTSLAPVTRPGQNWFVLNPFQDAVEDYGLSVGDYITVSGSPNAGNNITVRVTSINDGFGDTNNVIETDTVFPVVESPTDANTVLAIRSQYDTFPVNAGMKLNPTDVDIRAHQSLKDDYFSSGYTMIFYINSQQSGKTFLESQVYLPIGAYSLTRYGRLSVGYTRPPLPGQKLVYLTQDNVIDPDKTVVSRALTNRRFYNQIVYNYEKSDSGDYNRTFYNLDSDSLNVIGQVSTLTINSDGLRELFNGGQIAIRQSNALLTRFKNAAYEIKLKTNWQAGSLLEAGDVIVITDNGQLQIPNIETGERDLGSKLLEVIDRSLDIKSGVASITLLAGLAQTLTDRYGTIAPSSYVTTGGTTSRIPLVESFGGKVVGPSEYLKWGGFIGLKLAIHDNNYTYYEEFTLAGLDPIQPNILLTESPLSTVPLSGYIIDIANYSTSTDKKDQELIKIQHVCLSPDLTVVSGISSTQFTLSAPDALKVIVGNTLRIHDSTFTISSNEVLVLDVTGVTVTVEDLGLTPAAGQIVDIVGFVDVQNSYRYL